MPPLRFATAAVCTCSRLRRPRAPAVAVNVPYRLALELGHVRRICREDEALAQQVTALIVSNKEFRAHIMVSPRAAVRARAHGVAHLSQRVRNHPLQGAHARQL
eukprot:4466231-Prymnesium_polylepis.1